MIAIPRRQKLCATLALAVATAGLGCNSTPAPASPAAAASSAPAKGPAAVPKIVGSVLLTATKNPPPTGGVVYLEDAARQPGVATTATVDVDHKVFSPTIAVVATGGTVTFGNRDALTHHVFSPDVKDWDTGYLRKGETAGRTFDAPGAIALLCNIHPEMLGYVLVIPSSYFGKIGADGKYVIANVPPGTYRATAWSPRMPTVTLPVTVPALGPAALSFELRPAATTN